MSLDVTFHIHPEDGEFKAKGSLVGNEPSIKLTVGYNLEVTLFLWAGDDDEDAIPGQLDKIAAAVEEARKTYEHFLAAP
jgi:hypothetical protein